MTDQLVVELITEWKNLEDNSQSTVEEFCESILSNEDLFQAITHVLDENERFRGLYGDVIEVLFSLYRSSYKKLRVFSGQFIPSLIYVYLNQIYSQRKCVVLETLLRGMFEMETASEEIIPASVRIANVNLPSIYHDPGGVSTTWLSDNDLDRLNLKTVKTISRPTLVLTDEKIRAPQRLPLCSELWWVFNHRLPDIPKHSIPTHLKAMSRLVTQGFNYTTLSQKLLPPARIILSPKLLIEMVQTAYFSAYNGAPNLAEQVLEEISFRANYQLWADALLACNAVQDYIKSSELPIQAEVISSFKKSIITNASFRTKKLPDDIPIVEKSDSVDESEPTSATYSHSFKAKSKIPHILAKIKRNSVVVINEEGDVEERITSPQSSERKKSIDATAV